MPVVVTRHSREVVDQVLTERGIHVDLTRDAWIHLFLDQRCMEVARVKHHQSDLARLIGRIQQAAGSSSLVQRHYPSSDRGQSDQNPAAVWSSRVPQSCPVLKQPGSGAPDNFSRSHRTPGLSPVISGFIVPPASAFVQDPSRLYGLAVEGSAPDAPSGLRSIASQ